MVPARFATAPDGDSVAAEGEQQSLRANWPGEGSTRFARGIVDECAITGSAAARRNAATPANELFTLNHALLRWRTPAIKLPSIVKLAELEADGSFSDGGLVIDWVGLDLGIGLSGVEAVR